MNFVSVEFLIFLTLSVTGFILSPTSWRKYWLLFVSYVFYGSWNPLFLLVLVATTTMDYWMANIIASSSQPSIRKTALITGLSINISVLCYFKYTNFLLANWHDLLKYYGLQSNFLPSAFNIILPLGISFFTFEAISYIVDVYRGEKPASGWLDYNFYIMYFPHLISGPIIRFKELASQFSPSIMLPSQQCLAQGAELVLLGVLFKVFFADTAATLVDSVFANPSGASIMATYLAVLGFTVQIYFDFLGYTHIARGVSLFFNLELPLNFNHPYLARNLSDFWHRWHISLSRWIRDYIYIPLGGSRSTLPQTLGNVMVTMLICGAWHGAGWTYILWGGWHGALLAGYHLFQNIQRRGWLPLEHLKLLPNRSTQKILDRLRIGAGISFTFIAVVMGWILFRASDVRVAWTIMDKLLRLRGLWTELTITHTNEATGFLGVMLLLLGACFAGPWIIQVIAAIYRPLPFWLKSTTASFILILIYLWTADTAKTFIYFQF